MIRGLLRDQFGRPVAGADIALRETRTNYERNLASSGLGRFTAALLPLGSYDVTVRAPGWSEARRTGVRVRLGETVELTITLLPQMEEVVVEAAAPAVDVARSGPATRLPEEAVGELPNNGRNFLDLTLLTPGAAIVQGPDGDELSIAGQRGIHNNISVDGADFNNPFFGEQRGGQRPAFTFNLDAVQEMVVVPQGANAEFGRSSGGFVNVITKSGGNDLRGSLHLFGKSSALSGTARHDGLEREPDFRQGQFGFTLGGPLKRDRAFFFAAYDQQVLRDTRQDDAERIDARLRGFMDTAFDGALAGDYGPIDRTDDARALLAKVDWHLSDRHSATLKYNYTWSEQVNGTFDVDAWARSANAVERDWSHAFNGSLVSLLSPGATNELRFQFSREDRPRPYRGPVNPAAGRPFPDTAMDFEHGYRFGMPFFIPVEYHDTRLQLLNNVSLARGDHLIKAGVEWNRVESAQTFIGFANGRYIFGSVEGFLNFVDRGNGYVECSDGSTATAGACPEGTEITGPVLVYLQQSGVGGLTVEKAGTQQIPQHELALFVQDSWKATDRLTVDYGLRWEAQIQPDPITDPEEVFFAGFIGREVTNETGTYEFPSDGRIPSDRGHVPTAPGRGLGRAGRQPDPVARQRRPLPRPRPRPQPGQFALDQRLARTVDLPLQRPDVGPRTAAGLRRAADPAPRRSPPPQHLRLPPGLREPPHPQPPRGAGARAAPSGLVGSVDYTHARADGLTRFVNHNDAAFGSPWASGLGADGNNGLGDLTVVESTARSRYHGLGLGLRRMGEGEAQFQVNYTLVLGQVRRRQRARPLHLPLRGPHAAGPRVGLVRPRPAPPPQRLGPGAAARRALPQSAPELVLGAAGLRGLRRRQPRLGTPGGQPLGRPLRPHLPGRHHPPPQHPAQGPRVLLVGPAPVAAHPGGGRPAGGDRGGLQPPRHRQLPRALQRRPALQLRRHRAVGAGGSPRGTARPALRLVAWNVSSASSACW